MTPYDHFKESGTNLPYAPDHHSEDIRAIKHVIEMNNSLLVLGLSGSGKSSVLRFLVSNPAAQSEGMVFVYIDCNLLDWGRDREAVQEEIYDQIIEHLYSQLRLQNAERERFSTNKVSPRHALKHLMSDISMSGPAHLAIIFDRSELLQNRLGGSFFDYLRALRDINPRLSYIFSGRNLNPEEFGELTDILWDEPHWIGALSLDDAKMTMVRHLGRLGISLKADEMDKLLRCAGRHPGLLKYACESVRAEKINLHDDEVEITKQLLKSPPIERQCRDLWQDLDLAAQDTLRRLAQAATSRSLSALEWLVRCGILDRRETGEVGFTSAVFQRYVNSLAGPPPLTVEKGMVFKGSEALVLSKEEFDLFNILWQNRPQVVSHDQISEAIWPQARGDISPQMITNLVKRLRDKLGDKRYIDSVRGRGYRFL